MSNTPGWFHTRWYLVVEMASFSSSRHHSVISIGYSYSSRTLSGSISDCVTWETNLVGFSLKSCDCLLMVCEPAWEKQLQLNCSGDIWIGWFPFLCPCDVQIRMGTQPALYYHIPNSVACNTNC